MTLRIVRIHREAAPADNPLLTISHFHWIEDGTEQTGMLEREDLHRFLQHGGDVYVLDRQWRRQRLLPGVTPDGRGYVKTFADGDPAADPLLGLPECQPGE